jgi:hypothetical protein
MENVRGVCVQKQGPSPSPSPSFFKTKDQSKEGLELK